MINIAGYSIVRPLGKGGMAEVYLAIQQSVEREVALKILAPDLAGDPAFSERFLSEARIASRLVHPNIVTVYDVGLEGQYHFLSMEYIPGFDLKQARYGLPLSKRLSVVKDIAQALNFAGRKGYVHRDVKPDNIMLHAEDGRAVLMDFGIARPSHYGAGMTQTGTTMGTPHYMSPEQARGWEVDPRSDLYSLGVVLYLLLVGRVPFDADSPVAVGVQHVSEPIPLLPAELSVFQPILNTILSKDPDHRYQTGEQLVAALDALPQDELERLELSLFQGSAVCTSDEPQAPACAGYCSDTALTLEVTVPTIKRLGGGDYGRSDAPVSDGVFSNGVFTGKDRRSNPQPFVFEQSGSGYAVEAEDKNRLWPWWVGSAFAIAVGYAVYFQQQLPVEERLQLLAAMEQKLPGLAGDALDETVLDATAASEAGFTEETGVTGEAGAAAAAVATATGQSSATAETGARPASAELSTVSAAMMAAPALAGPRSEPSRERQVEALMAKAQRQHVLGDILLPPNANELHSLRQVLDLDAQNAQARQRVEAIEEQLVQGIEFQLVQEDWNGARAAIAQALVHFPASKRLQVLKLRNEQAVQLASQPKIERMLVSHRALRGVDQPQDTFLPAEHTLHVGFSFENFAPGTAVVQAHLVEAAQQLELAKVEVPITRPRGEEFLSFEYPQQTFADGLYRVDLTLNGQLLSSSEFQISHPPQL